MTKEQVKKVIYKDKSKSYTYCLHRNDGEIFYVGVGIRNRVVQHVMEYELEKSSNRLKANITKKELALGGVYFSIVCLNKDRLECLKVEAAVVAKFGRVDNETGILANLTDGGEIGPVGAKISEETRAKLKAVRQAKSGEASVKAKSHWDSKTEEEKQLQISRMRSRTNCEEARLINGAKTKERWNSTDLVGDTGKTYKELRSENQKKAQIANAEKTRQRMKELWTNPEYLEARRLKREAKLKD